MNKSQAAKELGLTKVQYKHMCDVADLAFANGRGESVALIWAAGNGTSGFAWLDNIAPCPEVRFSVSGLDIKKAISSLISAQGNSLSIVALWHSHQRSVEPSTVDIREFPSWLTELGAIYVVQGGETVFYTGDNSFDERAQEQMEVEVIE